MNEIVFEQKHILNTQHKNMLEQVRPVDIDFTNKEIRIKSIDIFYWFPRIISETVIKYIWIDGTEVEINVCDSIAYDIGTKLEEVMYNNGHYTYNTLTEEVMYYLQFSTVRNTRCITCISIPVPETLPENWVIGTRINTAVPLWNLPVIAKNPQFDFSTEMNLTEQTTLPMGIFPETGAIPRRYVNLSNNIYSDCSNILIKCNLVGDGVTSGFLEKCLCNGYHRKRLQATFDNQWTLCTNPLVENITLELFDSNEMPVHIIISDYTITLEYRDKPEPEPEPEPETAPETPPEPAPETPPEPAPETPPAPEPAPETPPESAPETP